VIGLFCFDAGQVYTKNDQQVKITFYIKFDVETQWNLR